MKQKILLMLSIISIILISLKNMFGLTYENVMVTYLMLFIYSALVILNFIFVVKFKISKLKLLYILFTVIFTLMVLHSITLCLVQKYGGPRKTIDTFVFPTDGKELLKNVYYDDIDPISPPIELVYERKLIFGIKCSIIIKLNLENTKTFNLKEEYNQLQNRKNMGFCNYKIKKYRIEP